MVIIETMNEPKTCNECLWRGEHGYCKLTKKFVEDRKKNRLKCPIWETGYCKDCDNATEEAYGYWCHDQKRRVGEFSFCEEWCERDE